MVLSVIVFADDADAAGLVKRAISTAGRWLHSDLPLKTVFTNATNTYDSGKKQTFTSSASTAAINIVTSSDPSSLSQGDIWFNTNDLKWQGSSVTQTAERTANEGIANGYTPLNSVSLIPSRFLGSGTNTTSNFLRGDNTWSTALVTSITGTSNNVTASASTGAVTLNLGSNVVVTGGNSQTVSKALTLNGDNTVKTHDTGLIIRNPLGTFATTIAGGAVTANTTLSLPITTDTVAVLGTAQTFSAKQTFGTATTIGKLAVAGATSGSTIINATAVAGSGFVTLPTSGVLFSGNFSKTNQTQASLATTDRLVFNIPLKTSTANIVNGIIFAKSSVAGTAVNMAFNLTAVAGGNHGTCHVQAPSTAAADLVANLKLPTVLTGRAISSAFTAWITASDPAPINFQCTVTMGSTASNLRVWINPEVTGATISADVNSFYILMPPT